MQPGARILALETSSRRGSAAIGTPAGLLATTSTAEMRHAADLLPRISELLQQHGWAPDSLTHVFVSIGPGSFTGLRVGVSLARTLAWATGAQIVAVPTLDALARNASSAEPVPTNLAVVLDAKRGQVYAAVFALEPAETVKPSDALEPTGTLAPVETPPLDKAGTGGGRRILGPVLETPGSFLARCPRPLAVLGEGIRYHREAVDASGVAVLDAALWPPRAENVLALGLQLAEAGRFTPAGELIPLYIRRPEAEEKWEQRHPDQPRRHEGTKRTE